MADQSPSGGEALTLAETFNVYFLQVTRDNSVIIISISVDLFYCGPRLWGGELHC